MLDAVLEDICLTFTTRLRVLLGTKLAEFLGTAGSEVGDAGAQDVHVRHHARE